MITAISSADYRKKQVSFSGRIPMIKKVSTASVPGRVLEMVNTMKSVYKEIMNRASQDSGLVKKLTASVQQVRISDKSITLLGQENRAIKLSIPENKISKNIFRMQMLEDKNPIKVVTLDGEKVVERLGKNNIVYAKGDVINIDELNASIEAIYNSVDSPLLEVRKFMRNNNYNLAEAPKIGPVKVTILPSETSSQVKSIPAIDKNKENISPSSFPTARIRNNGGPLYSYAEAFRQARLNQPEKQLRKKTQVPKSVIPKKAKPVKVYAESGEGTAVSPVKASKIRGKAGNLSEATTERIRLLLERQEAIEKKFKNPHTFIKYKKYFGSINLRTSFSGLDFKVGKNSNLCFSKNENKFGSFLKIVDYNDDKSINHVFFISSDGRVVKNYAKKVCQIQYKPIYYTTKELKTHGISDKISEKLTILEDYTQRFEDFIIKKQNKRRIKSVPIVTPQPKALVANLSEVKTVMDNAVSDLNKAIAKIKKQFGTVNLFNEAVAKVTKNFEEFFAKFDKN